MQPRQHQIEGATWALKTIREYGIAYLSWEERTGKTLTALLTVENSKAQSCLIVTKKKAIDGWVETLEQWDHNTKFQVINYESIHKIKGTFDFIILDEAHHAIAAFPKRSKTWANVAKFTKKLPILYLSATPYAESIGQLFHQFRLSFWCPIKYKSFYDFHRAYGIPKTIYTSYGQIQDYSQFRVKEVMEMVEHLFNFKTRKDVGIEHEPSVNLITITLHNDTKKLMKLWLAHRIITIGASEIVGDSDSKLRMVHYQLEGGTVKVDDKKSILLPHHEKVDYIKANYEEENIAIMAHFIKERELLEKEFPKARILSSDGHAEGVDLHRVEKLIVYSMSFKTSKYTQRLARQANHNRDTPIIVDILVGDKPAIGNYVYETVAIKKENFVKSSYQRSIQ